MRVLHCIETLGSGGVERRRLSLARYLPESFTQAIICSKSFGGLKQQLESYRVQVTEIGELGNIFNFFYYVRLVRAVRAFKPDVIHGAVFEGVISAVIAGILCRVPVIIIEETSAPIHRSNRANKMLRILAGFANRVIATSPAVFKYLVTEARIDHKKCQIILNGVEKPPLPENFDAIKFRLTLGIHPHELVIGTVGRLHDETKKVSVLIQALAELRSTSTRLLVVGDGKDKKALIELAKELKVIDQVIFVGFTNEPGPYYAIMDVFALVSSNEGFGIALVESMYFSLPAVGSRVGGIQYIVKDGITGLLVPASDVVATAKAISTLAQKPEWRITLGRNAFTDASKHYSPQHYAQQVVELYQSFNHVTS